MLWLSTNLSRIMPVCKFSILENANGNRQISCFDSRRGAYADKILAAGETEEQRAFINIGGRPMLKWVLDAVRGCDKCGDMLVVGDVERINRELGVDKSMLMADKGSMLENFMSGMERFRKSPLAINMTCDIPLLTNQMLTDLLGRYRQWTLRFITR